MFSMDNTQIQPIAGRPFLTSCHILSCFKMVQNSNDNSFKLIHKIAQYNYRKFIDEPEIIDEFLPVLGNAHFCRFL